MFRLEFKGIKDNSLELSIFLPVNLIHTFTELFYSLKQVCEYSERKLIVNNSHDTSLSSQKQDQIKEFEYKVLGYFDGLKKSGVNNKRAISETRKMMSPHPWASYQGILEVVRKHGRLKKKAGEKGG